MSRGPSLKCRKSVISFLVLETVNSKKTLLSRFLTKMGKSTAAVLFRDIKIPTWWRRQILPLGFGTFENSSGKVITIWEEESMKLRFSQKLVLLWKWNKTISKAIPDWSISDLGRRLIGFVNRYANDAASPPAAPSALGGSWWSSPPLCPPLLRHQTPTV